MKFRMFGTEITVTVLFAALIALMLLIDTTGLMLPMLFAVLLHELGHLVAMFFLRCKPKSVILQPAAVQVIGCKGLLEWQSAVICAAGPIANFIGFFGFYLVYKSCQLPQALIWAAIMLITGLFNLLPAKGLDGGTLLYCFLSIKFGGQKSEFILKIITLLLAGVITTAGLFLLFQSGRNPTVAMIGVYLALCVLIKQ